MTIASIYMPSQASERLQIEFQPAGEGDGVIAVIGRSASLVP